MQWMTAQAVADYIHTKTDKVVALAETGELRAYRKPWVRDARAALLINSYDVDEMVRSWPQAGDAPE